MLNVCFDGGEYGLIRIAMAGEKTNYSYTDMDCGKISHDDFNEARKGWIDRIYSFCTEREKSKTLKDEHTRFNEIIKVAKRDGELRVWRAKNPATMCGFLHLMYSLQNIDCKVFVVDMPDCLGDREAHWDKSWSEIEPDDVRICLNLQREISRIERDKYVQIWEQLSSENAELRVIIDGVLTSVPIDYLDDEILSYAPRDVDFKLGTLIGISLGNCSHYLSWGFIESRIEAMIDKGIIEVIERNDDPKYNGTTVIRVQSQLLMDN